MKKKIFALSVVTILLVCFAGGTLAYYTSEDQAHNVITTGGVKIAIQEWADEDKTIPFEDVDGATPSASVTKIAEVKNTGASDAWIRVKIEKGITLKGEGEPDTDLIQLDINTDAWTDGEDGYYYYNKSLASGEVTEPIFTKVNFSSEMGDDYQEASVTVDVSAQAVQSANNGEDVLSANGWPED